MLFGIKLLSIILEEIRKKKSSFIVFRHPDNIATVIIIVLTLTFFILFGIRVQAETFEVDFKRQKL